MKRPAWSRDPVTPTLLLFAGLIVAGFIAIAIGWRISAAKDVVAFQIPALVSGGLGGLVLFVTGAALANIQASRWTAAVERAEADEMVEEILALADDVRGNSR